MFEAFVFVDWSAACGVRPAMPRRDAIWSAEFHVDSDSPKEKYHPSRAECFDHVIKILCDHAGKNRRVLVGFDFPYGYPAGLTRALSLPATSQKKWSAIWDEITARVEDDARGMNIRFQIAGELNCRGANGKPGPFWGCPVGSHIANLAPRSPGFPFYAGNGVMLQAKRQVEQRLRGTQEAWKLFGNGSVGSQALTGIPYVNRLRRNPQLTKFSRVWPFETGFTPNPIPNQGPFILHAEIWPGVVEQRVRDLVRAEPGMIRDKAQVRAMCRWAAENDNQGALGKFFSIPRNLSQQQIQICVEEEGWVLGAV